MPMEEQKNRKLNLSRGFISLPRDLRDDWIGSDLRSLAWWVDLVLSANLNPREIQKHGFSVTLGRGQVEASISYLCERWHSSKPTITKYLNELTERGYIKRTTLYRKITLITICDFEVYCGVGYDTLYHTTDYTTDYTLDHKLDTNIKREKDKKEKIKSEDDDTRTREKSLAVQKTGMARPATRDEVFQPLMLERLRKAAGIADQISLLKYIEETFATWELTEEQDPSFDHLIKTLRVKRDIAAKQPKAQLTNNEAAVEHAAAAEARTKQILTNTINGYEYNDADQQPTQQPF